MFAADCYETRQMERKANTQCETNRAGISVTIRLIEPGDVVLIKEMHERLSSESVYYRYLGSNKPSKEDLQQLCSFDGSDGRVLVATTGGVQNQVIGVACYRIDTDNPTTAEPAILVEDDYQGCGLGKKMVSALIKEANRNGVETFDTFIHSANFRMLRMIKRSGLIYECKYCDGLKEVRVWLDPEA